MDPKDKKRLRLNRVLLSREMDPEPVMEGLVNKLIYTSTKYEDLMIKGSRSRINNAILNDIETRGPKAFQGFADSLVEACQSHLAEKLIPGISRNALTNLEYFAGRESEVSTPMEQESRSNVPSNVRNIIHVPATHGQATYEQATHGQSTYGQATYGQATHVLVAGSQECSDYIHVTSAMTLGKKADLTTTPIVCQSAASQQYMDTGLMYKMQSAPRGIACIINNKVFKNLKTRLGTDIDVKNLWHVFGNLNFAVNKFDNLTGNGIKLCLQNLSQTDHSSYDCLIVCILSHGIKDAIYGADEQLVTIDQITSFFHLDKCPTLKGKPKIFFIQACRGENIENGIESTDAGGVIDSTNIHATEQAVAPTSNSGEFIDLQARRNPLLDNPKDSDDDFMDAVRNKLPSQCDILLAYATVSGFVSWRNSDRGSWFIQALCEVILQYSHKEDLLSMMTMVNQKVASMYESMSGRHKQMPAPVTMLTKKLYFCPGTCKS